MSVFTDVKYAARSLRQSPSFSGAIVLTLALGIGATTAIFSVVDGLLLTPLAYHDSDRLVALWQRAPGSNVREDWLSPGQYTAIVEQSSSFEQLALFTGGPILLNDREPADEVGFLFARASFFRVLAAKPVLGRLLTEADDESDAPVVAVLTHDLWQKRYGGDADIVGRNIGYEHYPFEVVGILEPGFRLDGEVLPVGGRMPRYDIVLSMPRTEERMRDWENEGHNIIGRLRRGVSEAQAQAEMDVISRRLEGSGLQTLRGASYYVDVVPFLDQVVGRVRNALWMLLAGASLLLVTACMNVSNLLLAHGASRQREFGICAAIGAAPQQIVARVLAESVILAGLGCALGIGLAWGSVEFVRHMGPVNLPRLDALGVDGRTTEFALTVSVATVFLFGFLPALRVARIDPTQLIKGVSRTEGVLPKRMGTSSALAVMQISTAFVLLVGAGLLVRSFVRLLDVDPGFEARGRLALRLQEPPSPNRTPEEASAVAAALFRQVRALPGVRSVASATPLPFGQGAVWGAIEVDGYVAGSDEPPVIADRRFVSPGYFETMGIRLMRGRLFEESDARADAPPVRIVDRRFVEHFWRGQDAVGKWIGSENTPFPENRRGMVVGVVEHVRHYAIETDGRMTIYLPDGEINRTYLIVRADGDPRSLVQPVIDIAHGINRQIVVTDVRTMEGRLADARAARALALLLAQSFAAIAVLLSAIGLYGLMEYGISRGKPEIGIRMALGASATSIVRFVLRYGILIGTLGVAIGFGTAWATTRLLGNLLFDVSPTDAITHLAATLFLGFVSTTACWIPARRAAKLNFLDVLRA